MNSGIEELQGVLNSLSGYTVGGEDAAYSGAEVAGMRANEISGKFAGVNEALVSGWESVSDFYNEIDLALKDSLEYVRQAVQRYVEMTIENEQKEQAALKYANEQTAEILAEMGLE